MGGVNRTKALQWWNKMKLEQQFYSIVEWLKNKGEDTTSRHPHNITGREIEEIYNNLQKINK